MTHDTERGSGGQTTTSASMGLVSRRIWPDTTDVVHPRRLAGRRPCGADRTFFVPLGRIVVVAVLRARLGLSGSSIPLLSSDGSVDSSLVSGTPRPIRSDRVHRLVALKIGQAQADFAAPGCSGWERSDTSESGQPPRPESFGRAPLVFAVQRALAVPSHRIRGSPDTGGDRSSQRSSAVRLVQDARGTDGRSAPQPRSSSYLAGPGLVVGLAVAGTRPRHGRLRTDHRGDTSVPRTPHHCGSRCLSQRLWSLRAYRGSTNLGRSWAHCSSARSPCCGASAHVTSVERSS